ncbi:MAG: hypothetical protein FWG52_04310 [Proteobacteria bacterium]|nr:hypothetical protein [Pseudomonadota bacterium]
MADTHLNGFAFFVGAMVDNGAALRPSYLKGLGQKAKGLKWLPSSGAKTASSSRM